MASELDRLATMANSPEGELDLRALVENLPLPAYICDSEGLITFFNQPAKLLWGRVPKLNDSADVFYGSFKLFSTTGAKIAHDECSMALTLRTGKRVNGHEIVIERPDGQRFSVIAHAHPIRDESGRLLGAVNILDNTARKQSEKEFKREISQLLSLSNIAEVERQQADTRYQDLVDSVEAIVWRGDAQTLRYAFVSKQAERILGYPVARWLAEPSFWKDHIHLEDREWVCAHCLKAIQEKRNHQVEYRMVAADGRTVWIHDAVNVILVNGDATELTGIMVDITARKVAEEKLRRSDRRLAEAQRVARIGSWEHDLRGNKIIWSEETYRLFGREPSEEEMTLELFMGHLEPEDVQRIREPRAKAIRERKPFSFEYRITTLDGHRKVFQDRGEVVAEEGGQPIRLVGTVQDITERKQIEAEREKNHQQIRANHEQLQTLSRGLIYAQEAERRRLAGELHDEIGQILTAVSLSLELTKGAVDEGARGRLDESMAIVDRAIDQIRGMSLNLRPAMLDVMGLDAALRWFVGQQRNATGIEITFVSSLSGKRVAPDLETGCFRIVQESLTNVARHARARKVRVELSHSTGELLLLIQDDGTGFDVAAARLRATTGGSFGLLGMEERVRLFGGSCEIQSALGHGTAVRIRLPLS